MWVPQGFEACGRVLMLIYVACDSRSWISGILRIDLGLFGNRKEGRGEERVS